MSWLAPLFTLLNAVLALFATAKAEENGRAKFENDLLHDANKKAADYADIANQTLDPADLLKRLRDKGF